MEGFTDEFVERQIVNGTTMKKNINKPVSIYLKVQNASSGGKQISGQTSDGIELKVQLQEPLNMPVQGWIEVIGVPISGDVIKCTEIINFDQSEEFEDFHAEGHNMVCTFMTNLQDVYLLE